MANKEFAKGIRVEKFEFQSGDFLIRMGIHKDDFINNNIFNDRGYANFEICFAKGTGKPYCIVDDFQKTLAQTTRKPKEELPTQDDIDEIPF